MRKSRSTLSITLLLGFFLLASTAAAQQGIQVALAYYPANSVLNGSVAIPMFKTQDVQHTARAGVTYAFEGLPALSVSYILSDTTRDPYYTYFGAGVGLAFPEAPASSPSISGHALAGVNVNIARNFGAFTEVTVAGNSFGTRAAIGLGVTYTFGGSN